MDIHFKSLENLSSSKIKHMSDDDNECRGPHSSVGAVKDHRLVAVWDDSDIDDDGEVSVCKLGFLHSVCYDGDSLSFEVLRVNTAIRDSYYENYRHAAPIEAKYCPEVFYNFDGQSNVGRVIGAFKNSTGVLIYKIWVPHADTQPSHLYVTGDKMVETSKIKLGLDLDKSNKLETDNG